MLIDFYLRADTEAALAAGLSSLRSVGFDGTPVWATSSPFHALDLGIVIVKTPATVDAAGKVMAEAVLKPGFLANLRLSSLHPAWSEILAEVEPFKGPTPATPSRTFI